MRLFYLLNLACSIITAPGALAFRLARAGVAAMSTRNGLSVPHLVSKVNHLRHHHELEEAARVAGEGLGNFPNDPDLNIALGRVWLLDHKPWLASGAFTIAMSAAPDKDIPVAWKIAALSRQRKYDDAINLGTASLGSDRFSESVQVRVALGRVYLDSSQPDRARKWLEEAADLAPENADAVNWWCACLAALFQWDPAERGAEAATRRYRDRGNARGIALMWYRLGRIHLDNHRLKDAIACFEEAIRVTPGQHLRATEWRITALRGMGTSEDLALARISAKAAVEEHRNSSWLHAELAWVYHDGHEFELAKAAIQRAVELARGSAWMHRTHIDILRLERDYTAARNAVQAVPEEIRDDPRILIAEAAIYADQGDYVKAVDTVGRALATDKHNGEALRCKVDYLRHDYRLKEAADAAQAAIRLRSYDPDMYVTAAWVVANQGDYEAALGLAGEALAKDQRNAWALSSKIDFHRFAHEFAEAEKALVSAKEFREDNPDVYVAAAWISSAQGRPDQAAKVVRGALALYPGHRAALAAQVYFLRWSRQFEAAEAAAKKALDLREKDPDIQVAAGWLYSDLGRLEEALECADKANESAPGNSWVVSCRVNFLRAAGSYPDAERVALVGLEAHPGDPSILIALGRLYGSRGQFDKALCQFTKALTVNPWHLEALKWNVAARRGMLQFEPAETAAHAAIELRKQDLSLHVELGRTYSGMRRFDDAIKEYDLVLAKVPGDVVAVVAKSAALRASRRAEEAERLVTALRVPLPWSRDLLTELGWTRFDQRDWRRAKADFNELLLRNKPQNSREVAAAHYGLGWVDYAAGDYQAATSEFRVAAGQWPHAGTYKLGLAWSLAAGIKQQRDGRTGTGGADPWEEPERLAYEVAEARQDPFAHSCLGLIAFGRGRLGTAEYHLEKALALDKHYPRHTDLGALYAWAARYTEAEEQLRKAIGQDWYDAAAHVELGHVYLRRGDAPPGAQHEFRQALAADPQRLTAVRAVLGLATALSLSSGDADAEFALRDALSKEGTTDWRVHAELARVLMRRAEKQQNESLLDDAYQAAQDAIGTAEGEAEPQLVAGLVQYCIAASTREPTTRAACLKQARKHLGNCLERDQGNSTAKRYLSIISRQQGRIEAGLFARAGLAAISLLLLAGLWVPYALKDDSQVINPSMIEESTPILLAMLTLAALLPVLVRLKVAGFEANLEHQPQQELAGPSWDDFSSRARHAVPGGPAGEDFFNPGRFTVLGERSDLPGWGPAWPRLPESAKDPSV